MRKEQAELWQALPRLGMRYGDGTAQRSSSGGDRKSKAGKMKKNGDVGGFKMRPGRMKKPRRSLLHTSAEPKMATSTPRN